MIQGDKSKTLKGTSVTKGGKNRSLTQNTYSAHVGFNPTES